MVLPSYQKEKDGMAKSLDPDQTTPSAPLGAVLSGSTNLSVRKLRHCFTLRNFDQTTEFFHVKLGPCNAPVICNHCSLPPQPTSGNCGDSEYSYITALRKALLRVIALLFIIVNSMGYICMISQARHFPGTFPALRGNSKGHCPAH